MIFVQLNNEANFFRDLLKVLVQNCNIIEINIKF